MEISMDDADQNRDWRAEPRKPDNELCSCVTYLRTTRKQKDDLRLMARQRGGSEAQFLRDLIDREAKAVLQGQNGAKLAPSQIEADFAESFMKLIIRSAKSKLRSQE
jgi:hypothetical protein